MRIIDVSLRGTAAADGTLTVTAPSPYTGQLYAAEWIAGTFDNGVGAVLSDTLTVSGVNQTLLTLTDANDDKWYFPRVTLHSNAGANVTFDSKRAVTTAMAVVTGKLSLAITSGGNAKTGGAIAYILQAE